MSGRPPGRSSLHAARTAERVQLDRATSERLAEYGIHGIERRMMPVVGLNQHGVSLAPVSLPRLRCLEAQEARSEPRRATGNEGIVP